MKMNNRATSFVQRRAMSKIMAILAASMLLAGPGLNTAIAASDAENDLAYLGLDASSARPIADAEMGQMRGRFVPSFGGGQPVFFGVVMQSNVTQPSGTSLSAGLALGVDLKSGTPNVVTNLTWATQSGPTASDTGTQTPTGTQTSLGNLSGGVGQVIQVAGSANQANNQASIDITQSTPNSILPNGAPTGTPCGSMCQSSIQNNALQVSVNAPGSGTATQTIGPSVILQGIKLNGDMAMASNSMNMVIQMSQSQSNSMNLLGASTILQTIPR
jgi:hypothetical protein